MKKLLMTMGIILGFTAAVSAQSAEAKSSEALASKPDTKGSPAKVVERAKPAAKPVATTAKAVTEEKIVKKEAPQKVVIVETPVSKAKPAKSANTVDTDVQFKENKAKGKN